MPSFSAEGLTYQEARNSIKDLNDAGREHDDIYANINGGGVSITVAPEKISVAEAICKAHKASFSAGYTQHQEDVMMRSKSGYAALERVTNNAAAVYKEWQN